MSCNLVIINCNPPEILNLNFEILVTRQLYPLVLSLRFALVELAPFDVSYVALINFFDIVYGRHFRLISSAFQVSFPSKFRFFFDTDEVTSYQRRRQRPRPRQRRYRRPLAHIGTVVSFVGVIEISLLLDFLSLSLCRFSLRFDVFWRGALRQSDNDDDDDDDSLIDNDGKNSNSQQPLRRLVLAHSPAVLSRTPIFNIIINSFRFRSKKSNASMRLSKFLLRRRFGALKSIIRNLGDVLVCARHYTTQFCHYKPKCATLWRTYSLL